jgi:hypothetical protein
MARMARMKRTILSPGACAFLRISLVMLSEAKHLWLFLRGI